MASMLTHPQVWSAIDRLAARYGLSASGLAKKAGLDPTSFNRSKRITAAGRQRWPSTESIAKILQATGAGIDEFISLLSQKKGRRTAKPAATLRKGDRVVLRTKRGEILVAEFKRRSPKQVDVVLLTPGRKDRSLPAGEVSWIARIVWSSQ